MVFEITLAIALLFCRWWEAWTNFSWQDETWAEFSTLEGAACHAMHINWQYSNITQLRVENSIKTTFRFSPIRYRAPRERLSTVCLINYALLTEKSSLTKVAMEKTRLCCRCINDEGKNILFRQHNYDSSNWRYILGLPPDFLVDDNEKFLQRKMIFWNKSFCQFNVIQNCLRLCSVPLGHCNNQYYYSRLFLHYPMEV